MIQPAKNCEIRTSEGNGMHVITYSHIAAPKDANGETALAKLTSHNGNPSALPKINIFAASRLI